MNTQDVNVILKILDLILKHGMPVVQQMIEEEEKKGNYTISPENLESLFIDKISPKDFY